MERVILMCKQLASANVIVNSICKLL